LRVSAAGRSTAFGGASGKLNMRWYDLYFFLGAALLAFVYECIQQFYRQKPPVVEPSDGKEVDPPSPLKYLKEAPPLDGRPASTPALERSCTAAPQRRLPKRQNKKVSRT
jgi:hypothetical protein